MTTSGKTTQTPFGELTVETDYIDATGQGDYTPGRTGASLNGEPISRERYEEIVQALRRTVYVPSGVWTSLPETGLRVFHEEGRNIAVIPDAKGRIIVGEAAQLTIATDSGSADPTTTMTVTPSEVITIELPDSWK